MKRFLLVALSSSFAAASIFAQAPTIGVGAILPAATYTPEGLPSSGVAQGSFFTIFGTNLGPAAGASPSSGAPIPTTLGGTTVNVTSGGATTPALLFFVSPFQVNAVMPSNVAVGAATVTVTAAGGTSAPAPVQVVTASFGTFTQNAIGTGPADALDYTQGYKLTTLIQTAKPGDVELLFGTGLGAAPGGDQITTGTGVGTVPATNMLPALQAAGFKLYVGGVDVTSSVNYAGRSGFVGEDQINFVIPQGVSGCYVPVAMVIGNVVSNFGSISIDPNGAVCSDPFGLTPAQITQAASGKLSVSSILLTRLALNVGGISLTEDDAIGRFYQFNGPAASPLNNADFIGISSFGSCAVATCSNTSTCVPTAKGLASIPKLNAGPALTISGGSSGKSVTVPLDSNGDGFYSSNIGSSPLPLPGFTTVLNFFNPAGTFTVTGPGGPDVPAFTASVNVPAPITLNVSPAVSATSGFLDRTKDLTFTFTGGPTDYILMSASSATQTNTIPAGQFNSATVTCLQKASAGTFTIPSYLLQALPKSDNLSVSGLTLPSGAVLVGTYNVSNTFTGSTDVSLANSIVSSGTNTKVQ